MDGMNGIKLQCECGKRMRAHEKLAGKMVNCPACRTVLTVPSLEVKIVELESPELPVKLETPEVPVEQPDPSPVRQKTTGRDSTAGQVIMGVFNLLAGPGYALLGVIILLSSILGLAASQRLAGMDTQAGNSMITVSILYILGSGLTIFGGIYLFLTGLQSLSVKPSKVRASSVIALYGLSGSILVMLGAVASVGNGIRGMGFLVGLVFSLVYLAWPLFQYLLNRFVLFVPPKVKPRSLNRFNRIGREKAA